MLIVSEETSFGMPALICAWREGIWPWPACSTWPITTCSTCSGVDVGALERGLDRDAAELGGVERRQAAAQLADRACGRLPRITVLGMRASPGRSDGAGGLLSAWYVAAACTSRATTDARADTAPTRSPSASSRTRAIAHDVDGGALQALRRPGEAKPRLQARSRSRTPTGSAGSSSGSARATASTPSARASPPRPCVGRARELGTATLCWEVPAPRRRRASPAALVEGTLLAAYRFTRYKREPTTTTAPRLERAARLRATTTSRDAGRRAPRSSPRRSTRARDLQNAPANDLTPTALAERARELAAEHGARRSRSMGRERDRGARAWARSPPSRRAPTRSRS